MRTIQEFVACVKRQQYAVMEKFGQQISRVHITHRVPPGSTVVAYADPTRLYVNADDAWRHSIAGEPIKGVTMTFLGLMIDWDRSA